MEIVEYSQEYETAVVALWNRTLTSDQISVSKFRRQALFDENFDPRLCYVALESERTQIESRVLGFALATKRIFPYLERGLEPTRGWINAVFVDPANEKSGIATALLDRAEADLRQRGAHNITFGAYSPNYFFPGIDPDNYPEAVQFFEKRGYVPGKEAYSMCRDLHGYVLPKQTQEAMVEAKKAGYAFEHFDYKDALELLEFLKTEFGGGWKRNALIAMQNGAAEDCILVCRNHERAIVGFCMRMIDGNPMRFGPIGVAEASRDAGIGGILLDLMCEDMSRRGIYHMYFISTDVPGRRFYERHGFSVFRSFVDYRKELRNQEAIREEGK